MANAYDQQRRYFDSMPFREYKRRALRAAQELGYSPEVIEAVEKAETEGAVEHILRTARSRTLDEDADSERLRIRRAYKYGGGR